MSTFEILMPKMGESVEEATITKWFVKEGDTVEEDQVLLEIATDKVDSEIPSPVAGVIKEIKFPTDALVPVGVAVAIIALDGSETGTTEQSATETASARQESAPATKTESLAQTADFSQSDRFYSPLVKSIAKNEHLSLDELDKIKGTGKEGRVTKDDVLAYLEQRKVDAQPKTENMAPATAPAKQSKPAEPVKQPIKAPEVKSAEGGNGSDAQDYCRPYGDVETGVATCHFYRGGRCNQSGAVARKE